MLVYASSLELQVTDIGSDSNLEGRVAKVGQPDSGGQKLTVFRHLRSSSMFKYCVYYGKDRKKLLEKLNDYTLIITTYSIVRIDWKANLTRPEDLATLHNIAWGRIVLDEGKVHNMR